MRLPSFLVASGVVILALWSCQQVRTGGELHLKHEVTVKTLEGKRRHYSVVSLNARQSYNWGPGKPGGWGGIGGTLTGDAVRIPLGEQDVYFLLADPAPGAPTPASAQLDLVKNHFGFPNYTPDDSWVSIWKRLVQSNAAVELDRSEYPAIAVLPRNGSINEARLLSVGEVEQLGLEILQYELKITQDPVGASAPAQARYRPTKERYQPLGTLGRELFTVESGPS